MSTQQTKTRQTWRRGELMAELFLQELEPEFVARSTDDDIAFDFLVGFPNTGGGVNTCAVQVKATATPIKDTYRVPRALFDRLTHSNIPLILVVADVSETRCITHGRRKALR